MTTTREPLEGLRRHKLLPKALRAKLPPLNATDNDPDARVIVKFFSPYSNWTWYAFEFDGEDVFFGLVCGFEKEWGSFSLHELASTLVAPLPGSRVKVPAVERDCYWTPITKAQLVKLLGLDDSQEEATS